MFNMHGIHDNLGLGGNHVNTTAVPPGDWDPWVTEEIIGVCIVGLLVPFIVGGNILVIYAVAKFRRLQTPTNYLLVSLAAADICTGIFVPFITIVEVYKLRVVNITLCLAPHCLTMTVCGSSILCLSAIAYDRYTAISKPMEYIGIVTENKIIVFTVFSWIYSALIAWAPLFGWYRDIAPDRVCSFHLISSEALILLISTMFLPPYLIIFFCYTKILTVAKHHVSAIAAVEMSIHRQLENHFLQKDTKYAKTLAVVIGVYILLWLPYQVCILIEVVSEVYIEDWVRNYMALLSYLNSGINPWIYAFRNKEFKFAFKQILHNMTHCMGGRAEGSDSIWSALNTELPTSRSRSLSTGNLATTSTNHKGQPTALYITDTAMDLHRTEAARKSHKPEYPPAPNRRTSCSVNGDGKLRRKTSAGPLQSWHVDDLASVRSSDGSVSMSISNVMKHRDSLTLVREKTGRRSVVAWVEQGRSHNNIEEMPGEEG